MREESGRSEKDKRVGHAGNGEPQKKKGGEGGRVGMWAEEGGEEKKNWGLGRYAGGESGLVVQLFVEETAEIGEEKEGKKRGISITRTCRKEALVES